MAKFASPSIREVSIFDSCSTSHDKRAIGSILVASSALHPLDKAAACRLTERRLRLGGTSGVSPIGLSANKWPE